jgi:hypothetical protein
MEWIETNGWMDPIYSSTHFRHPKEGHFNSHRVKPPLSAQRAHQMNEMGGPTLRQANVFFGFRRVCKRGNIKRSALGECSLKKDTRVETANEGRFFITKIYSERVDGVQQPHIKFDSPNPIYLYSGVLPSRNRLLSSISTFKFNYIQWYKNQANLALASTHLLSLNSAWSCKTGKRIWSSWTKVK